MLRSIIIFLLFIPSVSAAILNPVMITYKVVGIFLGIAVIFMILGTIPLLIINKMSSEKLNDGGMMLAVSIPAFISFIIQWILPFYANNLKSLIITMLIINWALYLGTYFIIKSRKAKKIEE